MPGVWCVALVVGVVCATCGRLEVPGWVWDPVVFSAFLAVLCVSVRRCDRGGVVRWPADSKLMCQSQQQCIKAVLVLFGSVCAGAYLNQAGACLLFAEDLLGSRSRSAGCKHCLCLSMVPLCTSP